MYNVMFVCHGNICRSPMAEFVFNHMARRRGLDGDMRADSSAVSREEIGNPVHYGTANKLNAEGVPMYPHRAVQLTRADYDKYDYIVAMDRGNLSGIRRICGEDIDGKVFLLLDFTDSSRDIADPWYSGDFDATYRDVCDGCAALIEHIQNQK